MKQVQRKRLWRRICSFVLVLLIAGGGLSTLTIPAFATSQMTLAQLQAKYPDGSKWTDSFDGSIQCAGFARLLCYEAYGSEYYTNNSDGKWTKYTNSSYIDNGLKAGDLVRYKYDGHSVFITGVSGNTVSIADCNFDWKNTVRWTTLDRDRLKVGFTHAYSAPYELSGSSSQTPSPSVPANDLLTLSPNTVSIQQGQAATVSVIVNRSRKFNVGVEFSNSNICSGAWTNNSFSGSGSRYSNAIKLTGTQGGSTTMTAKLYDARSGDLLETKTVAITVVPTSVPSAGLTVSESSVTIKAGQSALVKVGSSSGLEDLSFAVSKGSLGQYACIPSWGNRNSSQTEVALSLEGSRAGNTSVTVTKYKAGTKNVVDTKTIRVNVQPSNTPTITYDKSSVAVDVGSSQVVNITNIAWNGSPHAEFSTNIQGLYSVEVNQTSPTTATLTFTGIAPGNANHIVTFQDVDGQPLTSCDLPVTVRSKTPTTPPEITVDQENITVEQGSTAKVNVGFTLNGVQCEANFTVNDASICSASWANSNRGKVLSIAGLKEGNTSISLSLTDSSNTVLASKMVNVIVKPKPASPPKPTAPLLLSASPDRIDLIRTDDVTSCYTNLNISWTGRVPQNSEISINPNGTDVVRLVKNGGSSTSRDLTVVAEGQGSTRIDVSIRNKATKTILASLSIPVSVSDNIIVEPIDPVGEETFSGFYMMASNTFYIDTGIIEDDIEANEDDSTVTSQGSSSIIFLPGYSASGSVNVGTQASASTDGSKPTGGQSPVSGSIEAKTDQNDKTIPSGTTSSTSDGASSKPTNQTPDSPVISNRVGGGEDEKITHQSFTDLESGKYYYNPVMWAQDVGITDGISGTKLNPNGNCPRKQVVEFLWRAQGCPEPTVTENPFADVSSESTYYKAVLWAYENDVTKGSSATEFSPEATCTRGQVVTFLWRAQGKPSVSTINRFSDVTSGTYYFDSVNWAVERNITAGTTADTFSPNDLCTRAQILTFLYRSVSGGTVKG